MPVDRIICGLSARQPAILTSTSVGDEGGENASVGTPRAPTRYTYKVNTDVLNLLLLVQQNRIRPIVLKTRKPSHSKVGDSFTVLPLSITLFFGQTLCCICLDPRMWGMDLNLQWLNEHYQTDVVSRFLLSWPVRLMTLTKEFLINPSGKQEPLSMTILKVMAVTLMLAFILKDCYDRATCWHMHRTLVRAEMQARTPPSWGRKFYLYFLSVFFFLGTLVQPYFLGIAGFSLIAQSTHLKDSIMDSVAIAFIVNMDDYVINFYFFLRGCELPRSAWKVAFPRPLLFHVEMVLALVFYPLVGTFLPPLLAVILQQRKLLSEDLKAVIGYSLKADHWTAVMRAALEERAEREEGERRDEQTEALARQIAGREEEEDEEKEGDEETGSPSHSRQISQAQSVATTGGPDPSRPPSSSPARRIGAKLGIRLTLFKFLVSLCCFVAMLCGLLSCLTGGLEGFLFWHVSALTTLTFFLFGVPSLVLMTVIGRYILLTAEMRRPRQSSTERLPVSETVRAENQKIAAALFGLLVGLVILSVIGFCAARSAAGWFNRMDIIREQFVAYPNLVYFRSTPWRVLKDRIPIFIAWLEAAFLCLVALSALFPRAVGNLLFLYRTDRYFCNLTVQLRRQRTRVGLDDLLDDDQREDGRGRGNTHSLVLTEDSTGETDGMERGQKTRRSYKTTSRSNAGSVIDGIPDRSPSSRGSVLCWELRPGSSFEMNLDNYGETCMRPPDATTTERSRSSVAFFPEDLSRREPLLPANREARSFRSRAYDMKHKRGQQGGRISSSSSSAPFKSSHSQPILGSVGSAGSGGARGRAETPNGEGDRRRSPSKTGAWSGRASTHNLKRKSTNRVVFAAPRSSRSSQGNLKSSDHARGSAEHPAAVGTSNGETESPPVLQKVTSPQAQSHLTQSPPVPIVSTSETSAANVAPLSTDPTGIPSPPAASGQSEGDSVSPQSPQSAPPSGVYPEIGVAFVMKEEES